jgi:hypothetical protein
LFNQYRAIKPRSAGQLYVERPEWSSGHVRNGHKTEVISSKFTA